MKQSLNANIDSEILHNLHNYAVIKHFNSDSEVIETAVKDYLKSHPLDKRKDLPVGEVVKRGPLASLLRPEEKEELAEILRDEHVYNHKRGDYITPSDRDNSWYYVLSGSYFERREIPSSHGTIFTNQDLISEDEVFSEELIGNHFESYWETTHNSRLLRIPGDVKERLIRIIPKIKDNFDYLTSQKLKKIDYLSTIRNNHLASEDKVKYSFNFLVEKLGKTINGELSQVEVLMPFHGHSIPMGHYSDYGAFKRIIFEEIGDLVGLSRESVSRTINNMCFQLDGKHYRIGFMQDKQLYVFKDLLNEDGEIIKLRDIKN